MSRHRLRPALRHNALSVAGGGAAFDPTTLFDHYWTLNETSGLRSDSVGDWDLTDNNTVGSVASDFGRAADFVSTNDEWLSRSAAGTYDVSSGFTVMALVNVDNLSDNRAIGGDWADHWLLEARSGSGLYEFFWQDSGGSVSVTSTASVSTGSWQLVIAWSDPSVDKIFIQVDDDTPDELAVTTTQAEIDVDFAIGNRTATGGSTRMNGLIDEFGIAARVLTASERAQLFSYFRG